MIYFVELKRLSDYYLSVEKMWQELVLSVFTPMFIRHHPLTWQNTSAYKALGILIKFASAPRETILQILVTILSEHTAFFLKPENCHFHSHHWLSVFMSLSPKLNLIHLDKVFLELNFVQDENLSFHVVSFNLVKILFIIPCRD